MDNQKKQKRINDKGITLVALMITIVLMLILASISITTSMDSLYNTQLKGFYTRLDIIQKRVDEIASTNENYVDENGNTVYIKNMGIQFKDLDDNKKQKLNHILEYQKLNMNPEKFRYFREDEVFSLLDLLEIKYNLFIDFDNRVVIAADGININGKMYYMLENNMYFPEYSEEKKPTLNKEIPLIYVINNYGTEEYKITITPNYDIEGYKPKTFKIKYKKTFSKYWETSTDFDIVIDKLMEYDIKYEDSNQNTVTKRIKVWINDEKKLTVTEITEEND